MSTGPRRVRSGRPRGRATGSRASPARNSAGVRIGAGRPTRGTARAAAAQDRTTGRAGRQRSIRSTITILLVIPLLSLIALWAYAAVSTVGGAIANQNDNTLNQEVGGPIAALVGALQTEGADTFVWQSAHALYQSAHGHLPARRWRR